MSRSVVVHVVDSVTAEDLAACDAQLSAVTAELGALFTRPEPKETFCLLVRGMLAEVAKKNCWGLSEYAGLPNPKRFQHLLNEASWDADRLRDWLRGYVLTGLADPDGALVLDDTQAIKKGTHSVGVAPQHCGLTGQTENCQCMVMLTYASRQGHAFVDRELYLPRVWTADRDRCRAAGVPDDRGLVTKPHLAVRMLQRALTDPLLVFRWVVADSGYGRDPVLRAFCHDQRLPYVFAVPIDLPLVDVYGDPLRPDDLLAATDDRVWERRSCGHGGKGERYWDFAAHQVTVKDQPPADGFVHLLLIRRALKPKVTKKHPGGIIEIAYFLAHVPTGTALPKVIAAAGLRWNIEDDNKCGKDQLGLDQYQVRKWTPWHRHVTISMLAHAFLAVARAGLGKDHPAPIPDQQSTQPRTPAVPHP
jgi:SRSO17 transposase